MNGIAFCLVALAFAPKLGNDARFFDSRVAPILARRCLGCHNDQLNDGGISFENRESLIKGGGRGAAVVPGKPEESVLIHAVRHDGNLMMPPGGRLSAKDVGTLTEWISRGAVWGAKPRPRR